MTEHIVIEEAILTALRAEVEELRHKYVHVSSAYVLSVNRVQHLEYNIEKLREEIEQLMATLQTIAEAPPGSERSQAASAIARRAREEHQP